eukprot:6057672-Alexandrium_andersonii.AAC.1
MSLSGLPRRKPHSSARTFRTPAVPSSESTAPRRNELRQLTNSRGGGASLLTGVLASCIPEI